MRIELEGVGKKYMRDWVFRNVNLHLQEGERYAVTGPNGAGKSTFLRVLSGHLTPTKGTVRFLQNGRQLPVDEVYQHIVYAAPYIELIEEFTLTEAVRFHERFKPLRNGIGVAEVIELTKLERAAHRPIAHFSSGMKQRLKLALALCSQSSYILLDEPTTNLDAEGMIWYQQLLETHTEDRTLIIASNVADDFRCCNQQVDIMSFKNS
ncbi:MAG: ABC transporter ATP-binding protein [Saprospiraceae bacterium]